MRVDMRHTHDALEALLLEWSAECRRLLRQPRPESSTWRQALASAIAIDALLTAALGTVAGHIEVASEAN